MVQAIRNIELALSGDGLKRPSPSESKNIEIARKSLALVYIKAGEPFTEANLGVKRPGSGISPMRWDDFIGRPANRDYQADELIEVTCQGLLTFWGFQSTSIWMTSGRLTAMQCMGTTQGHLAYRWILARGADAPKATEKNPNFISSIRKS